MSAMTEAISAAVTAKVMEQLKDSGIIPNNGLNAAASTTDRIIIDQSTCNQTPEQDRNNEGQQIPMTINAPQNYLVASTSQMQPDQYPTDAQRHQTNIVSIPAQDLVSGLNNPSYISNTYKPLGRPLYSKINPKLQDKIKHKEFIDMSDILVDHHPAAVDLINTFMSLILEVMKQQKQTNMTCHLI